MACFFIIVLTLLPFFELSQGCFNLFGKDETKIAPYAQDVVSMASEDF